MRALVPFSAPSKSCKVNPAARRAKASSTTTSVWRSMINLPNISPAGWAKPSPTSKKPHACFRTLAAPTFCSVRSPRSFTKIPIWLAPTSPRPANAAIKLPAPPNAAVQTKILWKPAARLKDGDLDHLGDSALKTPEEILEPLASRFFPKLAAPAQTA